MANATLDETKVVGHFELFPKLPIELRLQIWKASVLPRVVSFSTAGRVRRPRLRVIPYNPPILHASHEARIEGLRYYQAHSDGYEERARVRCNRKIYFNFQLDILSLFIASEPYVNDRMPTLTRKVRYLALHRDWSGINWCYNYGVLSRLADTDGFEEVILVTEVEDEQVEEDEHQEWKFMEERADVPWTELPFVNNWFEAEFEDPGYYPAVRAKKLTVGRIVPVA